MKSYYENWKMSKYIVHLQLRIPCLLKDAVCVYIQFLLIIWIDLMDKTAS